MCCSERVKHVNPESERESDFFAGQGSRVTRLHAHRDREKPKIKQNTDRCRLKRSKIGIKRDVVE